MNIRKTLLIIANLLLFAGIVHSAAQFLNDVNNNDVLYIGTKISPEIVNELKDFAKLIPESKIEEIATNHFIFDENFRKAFNFVRSSEYKHLVNQLLDMPEVILVLGFLHMTVNATSAMHTHTASARAMDATERTTPSSPVVNDNGMPKITTNAEETTGSDTLTVVGNPTFTVHPSAIELAKRNALAYKTSELEELEKNMEINGGALVDLPIVSIIQLQDEKENEESSYNDDDDDIFDHNMQQHQHPVGTFTSFVDEVIAQLPHTAYQNMIIEKCKKNAKFADFYRALRSPALKVLVDQAMLAPHVAKILKTFNSNNVDVKSMEARAFKVISWGPYVPN